MGKKTVFAFAVLVLIPLCGCLPGGTPPAGKIVENPLELQPVSLAKAKELAITSLGVWSLAQAPGAAVRIAEGSATEIEFAADVIREAGLLSGIYAAPSGPYLLNVVLSSQKCTLRITNPAGEMVWQEKYPLRRSPAK